ncbi:MAG: hypothetical protein OEU54_11625 [Gemmatimonadota bacterium]|nr:hypothetical protein [Gemmatimonadota bacterium]
MSARRLLFACLMAVLIAGPLSAQSGGPIALVSARSDSQTLQEDLVVLRRALEAQADALAHGLLPSRIERPAAAVAAAGGGGALGSIGTIASAVGPMSNSAASLTFERDPALSNSTSETYAIIGLGSAVVGGVLSLIAGGGGDAVASTSGSSRGFAEAAARFEESQGAAERLIDEFDRLSDEVGSLMADLRLDDGSPVRADAVLRRSERAFLRFDYVTRRAVSQLAVLRAGIASGSTSDQARLVSDVEAADLRLHRALNGTRGIDVAAAFSTITRLRTGLAQ